MEEKKKTPQGPYSFADPMTVGERRAALIYFPLHFAILPWLLQLFTLLVPDVQITSAQITAVYYVIGCIFVAAFMMPYLRRAFDALCDRFLSCIVCMAAAFFIQIALSLVVQAVLLLLGTELGQSPNNEAVEQVSLTGYNYMFAVSVFMAPIVEEILFRGGIFGPLRKRGRVLAYAVCVGLFSLYHVWQYAAAAMDPTYLLYAISYVPASIALCYAYEQTGSIWTPIFFHMATNYYSLRILTGQ